MRIELMAVLLGLALLMPAGCGDGGGDDDDSTTGDDDTTPDPCEKYATWEPGMDDDDAASDDDVASDDDDDDDASDDDVSDDDTSGDDDVSDDDVSDDDVSDDDVSDDDTGDDDATGDDDTTEPEVCDEVTTEPRTLVMSADDSNSQAAPALARQWIREGVAIDGGMRPYEFLNYYTFNYPAASAGHVDILPQMHVNDDGDYAILVAVVAPDWDAVGRRPRSITFSVDRSGSMGGQPLRNVRATMCEIAGNLQQGDIVSVVTWDSSTSTPLENELVDGPFDADLMAVIDSLNSGGSTNLNAGLTRAYELAEAAYDEDRLNRVLLMSDGGANTGQTDEDIIAVHSEDGDAEGIYLAGIGTASTAHYFDERLMNQVTDAGKGAYVYIDTADEADHIFGDDERFLSVMEVAAREVHLAITLPAGYALQVFHGEEVSGDPHEVEPQHLSPNDAMLYHFVIADCDPANHDGSETFEFRVDWTHPATREAMVDNASFTLDEMLASADSQIVKADAVVEYAKTLIDAPQLTTADGIALIDETIAQVQDAYAQTGDEDLQEIASLLEEYKHAM